MNLKTPVITKLPVKSDSLLETLEFLLGILTSCQSQFIPEDISIVYDDFYKDFLSRELSESKIRQALPLLSFWKNFSRLKDIQSPKNKVTDYAADSSSIHNDLFTSKKYVQIFIINCKSIFHKKTLKTAAATSKKHSIFLCPGSHNLWINRLPSLTSFIKNGSLIFV